MSHVATELETLRSVSVTRLEGGLSRPLPSLQRHGPPSDNQKSNAVVPPADWQADMTGSTRSTVSGTSPPEPIEIRQAEHWNKPRVNIWRLAAVFLTFMNVGANDASYGALIPYIQPYYDLSYTVVSLMFLTPFVGYAGAAFSSDKLHMFLGQRGVALIGPSCRLVAYVVLSVHPPWPVIVIFLAIGGLGNGLLDAGWNAWAGDLVRANEVLGLIHGFYGVGATIAPVIATSMVTKYGLQWYTFYYLMIGLCACELLSGTIAFWTQTGPVFRAKNSNSVKEGGRTRAALKLRVTWITSFFLLAYVGCEVSLGGWIVKFMINVRQAEPFASGMTATGFWLGITVGRVILGFITPKIGEKVAIAAYLVICMALELIFWLVPQFYVSAVAISLLGFFLGPMFPSAIIAISKLLPKQFHVGAIGFSSAVGGGGAAILPFLVGVIAQSKGVQVLQPIILAFLVVLLGLWLLLPRIPKHVHTE